MVVIHDRKTDDLSDDDPHAGYEPPDDLMWQPFRAVVTSNPDAIFQVTKKAGLKISPAFFVCAF